MGSDGTIKISDRIRYVIIYPLYALNQELPELEEPEVAQQLQLRFDAIAIELVKLEDELRKAGV